MSQAMQPSRRIEDTPSGVDDLDALLRAYFQAERPDPWPSAPLPEARSAAGTRRQSMARSRLALAASIALLCAGPWFIGTAFQGGDPGAGPSSTGRATADRVQP